MYLEEDQPQLSPGLHPGETARLLTSTSRPRPDPVVGFLLIVLGRLFSAMNLSNCSLNHVSF